MKRLFSLLLILCSFLWGDAQPVIQRSGAANTVNDPRHMASLNSFQPTYSDTTQANLSKGVDSVGAIIYTDDIKGFWYRQGNPKKWVRFSDIVSQTVNNITLLTDSSVNICTGDGSSCDTVTFVTNLTDLTSSYLLNDTALVVCNLTACDTVAIPKQIVYLFQNALTSVDGIQEWGGYLLHPTTVNAGYNWVDFYGITNYNYPYRFSQGQSFQNGTGIASFLHEGDEALLPWQNTARLGINYTGQAYSETLPGYFGSKVGYFVGTNLTGEGAFGLKADDPAAKIAGIFLHTTDSSSAALTLYGRSAPGEGYVAKVNAGDTLAADILTLHTTGDLTFHAYDSASRNDGVLTKVLGTDANGNVLLGRIAASALSGSAGAVYATNGLTRVNDSTVRLGGTLTQSTVIAGAGYPLEASNLRSFLFGATGTMGGHTYYNNISAEPTASGLLLESYEEWGSDTAYTSSEFGPRIVGLNAYDSLDNHSSLTVGETDGVSGVAISDDLGRLWVTNLPYTSDPVYKAMVRDTVTGKVAYTDWAEGQTYYALNGLSARNDSTFKLGGYLDEATSIKGLNLYGINMDSLTYLSNRIYADGYQMIMTQEGDVFKVEQTYLADGVRRNRFYWNTQNMYFDNHQGAYYFSAVTSQALASTQAILAIDQNDKIFKVSGLPEYTDNAAAITGGLSPGEWYHTAGVVKIVLAP